MPPPNSNHKEGCYGIIIIIIIMMLLVSYRINSWQYTATRNFQGGGEEGYASNSAYAPVRPLTTHADDTKIIKSRRRKFSCGELNVHMRASGEYTAGYKPLSYCLECFECQLGILSNLGDFL